MKLNEFKAISRFLSAVDACWDADILTTATPVTDSKDTIVAFEVTCTDQMSFDDNSSKSVTLSYEEILNNERIETVIDALYNEVLNA